jgi:hypothetical protein
MKEFITADLTDNAPSEICIDCARLGIVHGPTKTALVHCRHQITGAYKALGQDWKVIRGIESGHFRDAVLRGLTWGEVKADVERGLLGIIQNESIDTVKH